MSCTETCLRACSIKLTNGIDSGMRIPPCVYFACVRIPGAREDSHSLRNQLIWDTTGLGETRPTLGSDPCHSSLHEGRARGLRTQEGLQKSGQEKHALPVA